MKKLAIVAALTANMSVVLPALAVSDANVNLCGSGMAQALCGITVGSAVTAGIQAILVVALVLAFIFLVIGGIKWIMSGGDKAGTEAAKGTITAALIGLVIVFLAWAFLNLIRNFFGVDQTNTLGITPISK